MLVNPVLGQLNNPSNLQPVQAFHGQSSLPLTTKLNPDQEKAFQSYVKTQGPGYLSEPTRFSNGQLIPSSLYDLRGAWLAGQKPELNQYDGKPHWDDDYKLPGFVEPEENIGFSQFSNYSNLSHLFPQNAGQIVGNQYFTNPIQSINPNSFYPSWFGTPSHIPYHPMPNYEPLQGLLI